jgi:serine/threonine protein kinase
MDLREGNLSDLIDDMQEQPNYTENAIRYIAHQALSGLHFLHSKSVIHRDIKSDNVLFN